VTGVARGKFTRKGRRYVVSDTTTRGEDGGVVARGTVTGVVVYGEGTPHGEGVREPRPPAPAPLATLGPLVRTMTAEAMRLYEEPGALNLHTDDALARQAGLPAAIATGTLFLAYVFDLLARSYGLASLEGSELDVRIRQPVFAGDRLETTADVLAREGGRVEHAVRVRGPRGDVIAGTARVREPGPGA
jgi:acyl dehydratase